MAAPIPQTARTVVVPRRPGMRMLARLVPDRFLLLLVGTVLVATVLPARGVFAGGVGWLSLITIMLLFFFHGAKLARHQIVAGLVDWKLHLTILGCTFVMFPLVGTAATHTLPGLLPAQLWMGVLFVCALPSTVQSAIAFVSIARGNLPAAIASASASQMLGIVLTPLLMGLLAGAGGGAGQGVTGVARIAAQILLPFVAGHLARPKLQLWMARHKSLVGITDRATIIVSVYGAFSAAVIEGLWHRLPMASLAVLVAVDGVLLAIGLAGTWLVARLLGFSRADIVTIQFCGTKKSLVQGVPMARILFPGPQSGVILLPLMIFHQMQLMACAFIAKRYAAQDPDIDDATLAVPAGAMASADTD